MDFFHIQWEKKLQELNAQVTSEAEQRQTSEKKYQEVYKNYSTARVKLGVPALLLFFFSLRRSLVV